MKILPFLLLAIVPLTTIRAAQIAPPVIGQQADGLIVLNPEAAAFVMTDVLGRHVMNATDPRLKIIDGKIRNLGERFQYPSWRFLVNQPGKFDVYLDLETAASEDCSLRLNFVRDGKEGRLVVNVPRHGNDGELYYAGETGLADGVTEAQLTVWAADHSRRLPDIGRMILVPADGSNQAFEKFLSTSKAANPEALRELGERLRVLDFERKEIAARQAKAKPGEFSAYDDFVQWDADTRRLVALDRESKEVADRLRAKRLAALAAANAGLSPEDAALVAAVRERSRLLRERAAAVSGPMFDVRPSGPAPLYPPGGLDVFKDGRLPDGVTVVELPVASSARVEARRQAFAERNSPRGLEELARRLNAALRPDVPGLAAFYEDFAAGRYAQALDAYRDYFFRKLKDPSAHGAEESAFTNDFFQRTGKALILRRPYPEMLKANIEGSSMLLDRKTIWKARLGPPGNIDWAPEWLRPPDGIAFDYGRGPDDKPFWKTEEGKKLVGAIEFYRMLSRHPSQASPSAMFPELLYSYAFGGDPAHLKLYADYMDDWAMHSTDDLENSPLNLRAATELQVIGWYRILLRVILDERPDFARDFPAPTLARMLLALTELYHPYVIRAKRAEIANWGIMGVDGALKDSKLFNEFRSMDYTNRELSRLARMNYIQHLSLDGENLESWDEGHVAIDGMLEKAPDLTLHDSPVLGAKESISLLDHNKTMQRTLMTHLSPEGEYWVSWLSAPGNRSAIREKIIDRNLIDDVMDEPEVRRRFDAVLGKSPPARELPLSDLQPYAQMAYLRDGFGGDATSLIFQNFPVRSQNQGWIYNGRRGHIIGSMRTQYSVARDGRGLLEATPIIVDSKPPNRFLGMTRTGGKTDFSFRPLRHVQPGVFISTPEFDVIESEQDSPYGRFDFAYREILGLDSKTPDEPIRDVRAVRHIVHLRGESVFVIGDRIFSSDEPREFAQMFIVPVRVAAPEEPLRVRLLAEQGARLLEIDEKAKAIRSFSPGLPNVSLYLAGHDFAWGGRSKGEKIFDTVRSVSAADLQAALSASKDPERTLAEQRIKTVSVRWSGEGNQALAAAVVTRPAVADPAETAAGEITNFQERNGANGIAGFSFTTATGTEVWYQIAPSVPAKLSAGPASASAGSLLVVRRAGGLSGVVSGGDAVMLNGLSYGGPSEAFVFTMSPSGNFTAEPLREPIDTTVIAPQQTVFSDKVTVSFSVPGQKRDDLEFRYTLDGSDPTLESALYTDPFDLADDTLVKVRPFRKGLTSTPWNIAGVDGGKTVSAIFRRTTPHPPVTAGALANGLNYEYFEDSWLRLVSHSGIYPYLPVKAAGVAGHLLDPAQLETIRRTDRAFAVKYDGFIDVPASGIYRFFAPDPLYSTHLDAGYELRVWIDGEEWFPNPDLHAENIWSVALEKGLHRFQVSYVDYRWKQFRNEYWMAWNPGQMAPGVPILEVDGPGLNKQALPPEWLKRTDR